MKAIYLLAAVAFTVSAQSFTQGPTEVTVTSLPVISGSQDPSAYHQMVCAKSTDAAISDIRVRGQVTLVNFQTVEFDLKLAKKSAANATNWKYPSCQIVAVTGVPALMVSALEATPRRADPVIVFIASRPR
jgi:hypothetical protein